MKRKILAAGAAVVAVVVAVTLTLTLTGHGSSGPNPAACKAAMRAQYATALTDPNGPPASEPPACKGVPTATLDKYAIEIMAGQDGTP